MYTEATYGGSGDATALTFPEFTATGRQNVQFKYHMHGPDSGTLLIQAKNKGDNSIATVWSMTGDQGSDWKLGCISLGVNPNIVVELSFVAVRGSGPIGDIAVDDILVTDEECSRKNLLITMQICATECEFL